MSKQHIRLPYDERPIFEKFHRRHKRWACLVAHRRAGKTVAVVNDLILQSQIIHPPAPYAYFAPYRSQAKSVAWDYFKLYAAPLIKSVNEAELKIVLNNGSALHLFGADNADAARGMGFMGLACDEYGDFRPSVWGNVLRPTLSDRKGFAVFMGTPKGHNQFYDVWRVAQTDPDWFPLVIKASTSGILDPGELIAARKQLSEDQYNQEYECSFDAAILGAFYGREMMAVDNEGRLTHVPHDPEFPVFTAWDIGHTDDTAIWFYQNVANQVRVLDHFAVSGGLIEDFIDGSFQPGSITQEVLTRQIKRGYRYERHWLPHDARAKTLGSDGKSVVEKLSRYLGQSTLAIVPNLSITDGIQAVRTVLPRCWFDHKCNKDATDGVEALRQYQREYDEDKKAFKTTPRHDWCSHPCFTGDTSILTRYGTYQIMDLPFSGEVLTSCGWKRYENPRITRTNASLVEVVFSGGYSVRCTPDHLFKTESGWKSAESLTPGTPIQSGLIPSRSILMDLFTGFGRTISTFLKAAAVFIVTFGRWHSAQFLMGATSTIEIATLPITDWQISNVFPQKNIFQGRGIKAKDTLLSTSPQMPETQPQHGILRKKEDCGIDDMPKNQKAGLSGSASPETALGAVLFSIASFARVAILKSIAALPVKLRPTVHAEPMLPRQLVIEQVKNLDQKADVWCLTVPDAEEFSLANGAIVHNCDAFRMLAVAERRRFAETAKAKKPFVDEFANPYKMTLDELWEAAETKQMQRTRI